MHDTFGIFSLIISGLDSVGRRLGFIGDFLNKNFMVSLLCSFNIINAKASKWKRKRAWKGVHFPSYNVNVGYHRAVLLSKFAK
jgi:hypothetical protein